MISDLLETALIKAGSSKALADMLEVSPSDICRVRSGETGLKLKKIEKLVEYAGFVLVEKEHEKKLKEALKTVSALWAEADR